MPKRYPMTLNEAIAELQEVANEFKDGQEIDLNLLVEVTKKSHELILRLQAITQDDLLKELISKQLFVVQELHKIAQNKELLSAPPPQKLLGIITSSFESFFNKIMSKRAQKTLKNVAEFIPCVSSVVYCCETMPYFWAYANRAEKIGMLLGAALIITALAVTIAYFGTPAIASILVLGLSVVTLCKVGSFLYKECITDPSKKYDDHAILKATIKNLEDQEKGMLSMAQRIFAPNATDNQAEPPEEKPKPGMLAKMRKAFTPITAAFKIKAKQGSTPKLHFKTQSSNDDQTKKVVNGNSWQP